MITCDTEPRPLGSVTGAALLAVTLPNGRGSVALFLKVI
jgi:hypothetical protein